MDSQNEHYHWTSMGLSTALEDLIEYGKVYIWAPTSEPDRTKAKLERFEQHLRASGVQIKKVRTAGDENWIVYHYVEEPRVERSSHG